MNMDQWIESEIVTNLGLESAPLQSVVRVMLATAWMRGELAAMKRVSEAWGEQIDVQPPEAYSDDRS